MSCKSGYCDCLCRDCFEIAMSDFDGNPQLCNECKEAGCSEDGESECQAQWAYGMNDADDGTINYERIT